MRQLCNKQEIDMDERLEAVSEKIRMGIPVSLMEALEAIDYQQKMKAGRDAARAKTLFGRFMRWIRGA
jgi:rRNA-processing protein FCF1